MTRTAAYDKRIRRHRRLAVLMLGYVATVLGVAVVTRDRLTAMTWTILALFTVMGILGLVSARLIRLDLDDPAGIERRERRFEAGAIVAVLGLPLAALLILLAVAVVILVR